MTGAATGKTEVWQARIGREFAAQLHADADVLGLEGRTDIVKAALALLHRNAAEQRMAHSVDEFYGEDTPPLPIGVLPAEDDPAEDDPAENLADGSAMVDETSGARGHA